MFITSLEVQNFRNLKKEKIELTNGLNVFCGKNAQGKTNLLESIFISGIGKSPRVSKIKECIMWDADFSIIKIKYQKAYIKCEITFKLTKDGKKIILINGVSIKSLSELIGEVNLIYFFPEDLKLIKEAPIDRRKFMDIDISQASKFYFTNLNKYNTVLQERNKLLKNASSIEEVKQSVFVWDEQLSEYASNIIISRIRFLKKLSPLARQAHFDLSGNKEKLDISYDGINEENKALLKEELLKLYQTNLEKDFSLGHTSIGPHKDDIKITLDGKDLRLYGSQGQQRTASLALKFAEIELFKAEFGEEPILLLDDVLSELDEERRAKLIAKCHNLQCIITTTDWEFKDLDAQIFTISGGKIYKNTPK